MFENQIKDPSLKSIKENSMKEASKISIIENQ